MKKYDIIVLGGGHAGIEASFAAAKLGCSVLLLTLDRESIGKLSCNPAVGGVAKGHLVKEVDSLGGLIGRITDKCALGYRTLNRSKGKAVWATRVQVDMFLYSRAALFYLEKQPGLKIMSVKADKVIVNKGKVCGIETNFGDIFTAKSVIICAGTFLNSKIHIGLNSFPGGRLYEPSSDELFKNIKKLGFLTRHFKTGTCARLDGRTLNYSKMTEQSPEYDVEPFSFFNASAVKNQLSCFITRTNKKTHRIISGNLHKSPLYTRKIKAKGVRYCPSLEDKVVKFPDKESHQIFIEPSGRDSCEVYPNGISTSLPFNVQERFIHSIEGLENASIIKPGYGIEHGLIDARQLYPSLESKIIKGLYFAGQVNGTTGYEEAAAQGIVSGINAALYIKKKKHFIFSRRHSFIGVLIDDLTTKGADEPYRMFTSRSEFRLSLRESNAHFRLASSARSLGLINKGEYERVLDKKAAIEKQIKALKTTRVFFNKNKSALFDILKRPDIDLKRLQKSADIVIDDSLVSREVEIIAKYEGFLKREQESLKILSKFRKIRIPRDLEFDKIPSLSKEVRDKLNIFKPLNLEDASGISGITPAACLTIYAFITRKNK